MATLPPSTASPNCEEHIANPTPTPIPTETTIIDWIPPPITGPLKVRRAAHLASPEYIAKYERATELMKILPRSDPRNFCQQSDLHHAYCGGGFEDVGLPIKEMQVHFGWLFFPWHRLYLYFYERILAKQIEDDSFALPFWNWDAPDGMTMPAMYTRDACSSLYDPLRDEKHQPPKLVDFNFHGTDRTSSQPIYENLQIMHREMIYNGSTPEGFMGLPYYPGDKVRRGAGSVENIPHNMVHNWTGDPTQDGIFSLNDPFYERSFREKIPQDGRDMGVFETAARDPIFFAHHSNVDRLWNVWKQQLGGKEYTNKGWFGISFLLYDENGQLVRVKVEDCLDTKILGYTYQDVPNLWVYTPPTPTTNRLLLESKKTHAAPEDTFPLALESAVTMIVKRPKVLRSNKEIEEEKEVLVVAGVQFGMESFTKFDVFINAPEYKEVGPGSSEFAGSFVSVPHSHKHKKMHMTMTTTFRLWITKLLEDVDAKADESVLVTLVPRSGTVIIEGIQIEFTS